ncbi:hypothetical protein [Natrononativus amylolyticus]|uniref:hypothetical protein n=1 Tax=Natrononativus amylolyticus TaxID=2963434 RepID=UPI0020CC10FA|nr:hypothetical protein [Natrononativus amylolyticus]
MTSRRSRSSRSDRCQSTLEPFAAAPAKSLLLSVGPVALAAGQLLNGYVNGLSPGITVPFAIVLIWFAVVATRHHAAEHRLRRLESDPA